MPFLGCKRVYRDIMILVTGAAGKTGQVIIRALAARNQNVRALVRREHQIAEVQAIGAVGIEILVKIFWVSDYNLIGFWNCNPFVTLFFAGKTLILLHQKIHSDPYD